VTVQDYATALHASSLIRDGGTLQIGIGSLGDAVAHACLLREKENDAYRAIHSALTHQQTGLADDLGAFNEGLYVSTEMFVNGMMHLIEQGVVKRRVFDDLNLQKGLNSGAISESVDETLFDYGRTCGLIPRRLDEASLQQLAYWGILPRELVLEGNQLRLNGTELPNDLDEEATRQAILAAVAGTQLQQGRIL
ncbi:MAG: hypothetical protein V7720_18740, partial [Halioglobus sp.]